MIYSPSSSPSREDNVSEKLNGSSNYSKANGSKSSLEDQKSFRASHHSSNENYLEDHASTQQNRNISEKNSKSNSTTPIINDSKYS